MTLAGVSREQALAAAEVLELGDVNQKLAAALLELHSERAAMVQRQQDVAARFTSAHPGVPVVTVVALPQDVHDLGGLREIGELLAN